MKFLDNVKVINDNYEKYDIHKGMIGTIIDAEIRNNCFHICFQDQRVYNKEFMSKKENIFLLNDDICHPIKIKDLELIKDNHCTYEKILESIPQNNTSWWCMVENGFILNLKGEKKNKIPYDYDS